jgi:hypothetical protein
MRKGKIAYARKSVLMPIKETFQMPDHLPERTPTPTEDEAEDHDSSIQIIEHITKMSSHVFLSDEDTLSITAILNAVMENDASEGSVHDSPHEHGKEVMMEAPKNKVSKKDLRRMEKELKKAMEEASAGSLDESVPMDLDTEEAPQRGKEQETSTRRRSGRRGVMIDTDPYLQPG